MPPITSLYIDATPLLVPDVGVGVYTLRLIQALGASPYASKVTVLLPEKASVDLPGVIRVRRVVLPKIPIPLLAHFFWATRMAAVARRENPAALFHSPGPWVGWGRPRRFVVTLHDSIARRFPRYQGKWLLRRAFQRAGERIAAGAEQVLTDSACSKRDLVALAGIPEKKIKIVYPWVDSSYRKDLQPEAWLKKVGLPRGYWLYVGGYDYRKNVEFLLAAYAQLRRQADGPPLVLAGRIPRDLRKPVCDVHGTIRALGLTSREVLFPGFISDADLPFLYAGASLMIYPSLYEGFGLPPAEAMAVGTPVLVSDTSSLPEVVRKEECRFRPDNSPQLLEKLRLALRYPESFRCELPPEFNESMALQSYLQAIGMADS